MTEPSPAMNLTLNSTFRFEGRPLHWWLVLVPLLLACSAAWSQTAAPAAATATAPQADPIPAPGGPVRLRQPVQASQPTNAEQPAQQLPPQIYKPSEFETYVQGLAAQQTTPGPFGQAAPAPADVRRFGSELLTGSSATLGAPDYSPIVPPDYLVQTGDELLLTLWGSVDADLRLQVDRSGRISLPRVGPIMVSGVRYGDLADVISKRVALVFKNFQLSVSLGQLRGLRVYVTGFVQRPGVQVVSSLSTLAQALMRAGGPSAAGSFRDVQLRRGRELVARFDLYDLLLKGDREADRLLQADDVVHVGPIGAQVAVIGSVNRPALFELKPGETVDDVLRMAGGFAAVADTSRLALERLDDRTSLRVTQIDLPATAKMPLRSGDLLRAFNAISVLPPTLRQNKRVRVEGEVGKPGEYVLPANSTLADALGQAGGTTSAAFLFGAEFYRESVRATQQVNYDRALRDLETDLARQTTSRRTTTADEAIAQSASSQATAKLLERLRAVKPTGRVILQLPEVGGQLPALALEDGDRLYVPPQSTAVGVFGSVFNSGSYLFSDGRNVGDYMRLAGGPTRGADDDSTFIVRANGSVVSGLQSSGWFSRGDTLQRLKALPGDTIFVPEDNNKYAFMQATKDWTQIFFQIGVGLAGIKSAVGF